MKALILAAGEGRRLLPLTLDKPKSMLPICGKPLLVHIIALLKSSGIKNIAINLYHKPEAITDYFGDGSSFGVNITYSHEVSPMGTAGAVWQLRDFFDSTFFVIYGDVLTNINLRAMAHFHYNSRGPATIALYSPSDPCACGIVELDDCCTVSRFLEKPPRDQLFSVLANAGIYVLEPQIIDRIPPHTPYDFGRDFFPDLVKTRTTIRGYRIPEPFFLIDIGTPENYDRAQKEWPKWQTTIG